MRMRFEDRDRMAAWIEAALALPDDSAWRLEEHGYDPNREGGTESRLSIGNGLLGVRGSLEPPLEGSFPRTYVAGLFDTPPGPLATPALVPAPDWLRLRLLVEGEELAIEHGQTLEHRRTLDMRRGVLVREWRQREPAGRVVRLRTLRFVSLADRSLAVQIAYVDVEQPARLVLEAWLESSGAGLRPLAPDPRLTLWRTTHTGRRLALAWDADMRLGDSALPEMAGHNGGWRRWEWAAAPDRPATFVRIVAIARGEPEEDPRPAAQAALEAARQQGVAALLEAHSRAWEARWRECDVEIEGDEADQRALRFADYHLIGHANPADQRVSIAARGLTGEAYRGHVFWDTEIFLLPFYTLTWPEAARAMLIYRYHTLPAARAKAARLGYRGALYAWESADSGEEATPRTDRRGKPATFPVATQGHHISADVAYAVWRYWQTSGDDGFLREAGAEIVLETARFWASRVVLEQDGRYHIRGVIGPDEYHEGVDDNAYTNGMAQWNLEHGVFIARLLAQRWPACWAELRERLRLDATELDRWQDVADRMETGMDQASGLFEQFADFFDLESLDLADYADRDDNMDMVLGRERIQRVQVIKQADVVMLLALLWERYPLEARAANFRYYAPRCDHGSSLSPAMHALVAARLGDVELAARYFRQAAAIDLEDSKGNAADGVHMAALGGLWQAAIFGFAGLSLMDDGLRLDPQLPRAWQALRFRVQWHGSHVRIAIQRDPLTLTATLEQGAPLRLAVGELVQELRPDRPWTWAVGS